MHADRIYVLERGSIVEYGHHTELLANKGLYYAMWRQQVGERRLDGGGYRLSAAGKASVLTG
jgi:ATP-binding cassette subfamily B protein